MFIKIMLFRFLQFIGVSVIETKHIDSAVDQYNGSIILTPTIVTVMKLFKGYSLIKLEYLTGIGIIEEVEFRKRESDVYSRLSYFRERIVIILDRELSTFNNYVKYWTTDTFVKYSSTDFNNIFTTSRFLYYYHGDSIAIVGIKDNYPNVNDYSELVVLAFDRYNEVHHV